MNELRNPWLAFAVACVLGLILFALIPVSKLSAHDHEHPELNEWYSTLMQPDIPTVPSAARRMLTGAMTTSPETARRIAGSQTTASSPAARKLTSGPRY